MATPTITLKWDTSKVNSISNNMTRGLLRMGHDMANMARSNAPYKTGALSNSIRVEENAGIVEVLAGGKYAGRNIPYAAAVEFGHRQTPGRFVPGRWSGDKFIYDRTAKGGMVLKKSYVRGSHYMERAKDHVMAGNYLEKYFGDVI